MKAENLLDMIGEIDDGLIREAGRSRRPAAARWKKRAVTAACFCLAAAGPILFFLRRSGSGIQAGSTGQTQTIPAPEMPAYSLSVEDVAALFSGAADNKGETNQYDVVYARKLDELCGSLPETGDTIDIYSFRSEAPDPDRARSFFEKNLPFFRSLSGVSSEEYDWTETADGFGNPMIYCTLFEEHVPEDGEGDEAWTFGFVNLSAARNQYSVYASKNIPLTVRDAFVGFPASASDEEIRNALTDTIRWLNESLGTSYSEVRIHRAYGDNKLRSVSVFLYDGSVSAFPELVSQQPLSSGCVTLTFYSDWGEGSGHDWSRFTKDDLLLGDVSFCTAAGPWEDAYSVLGTNRMLSLKEAEEMLARGYVWGGHSCPLCMAEQDALDFSDYDGVTIEYVHGMDSLIYVPFYAFYKQIEDSPYGMPSFAKTYVCAVEIDGLDEYFKNRETYHAAPG